MTYASTHFHFRHYCKNEWNFSGLITILWSILHPLIMKRIQCLNIDIYSVSRSLTFLLFAFCTLHIHEGAIWNEIHEFKGKKIDSIVVSKKCDTVWYSLPHLLYKAIVEIASSLFFHRHRSFLLCFIFLATSQEKI